jgi:hypothetical protein
METMANARFLIILLSILFVACDTVEQATPAVNTPTPTQIPLTSNPPTHIPGALVVDPSVELGAISPYILGSNYGPWIAVPVDMLPAAYDSKVTAIRFPGGAWGDRNDLKPYHIDPFMEFTEEVGAIPTITVRLREGDPQQAADLVRYVNIENDHGVVYWTIGNEPTLFADELRAVGRADDYDTEQFNKEWRDFALAMKEVDPSIKLLGPEIHQFSHNANANPKDSSGRDWMTEFLKANGV